MRKYIITSMIFELIQFRWFRKLRKGEYKLISPRFKEVGSFWTDSGYFYKEDEVIDVEIYTKGEKMPVDFSELNLTEEEIKEIKQDIIWTYQSEKNNAKEKLKEDILKLIGTYEVEYNDRIHELTINAENLIMTTKTY